MADEHPAKKPKKGVGLTPPPSHPHSYLREQYTVVFEHVEKAWNGTHWWNEQKKFHKDNPGVVVEFIKPNAIASAFASPFLPAPPLTSSGRRIVH